MNVTEVELPFVASSESSAEAAQGARKRAPEQRERVLSVIRLYGPLSDALIASLTGLPENSARPRRVELARQGKIQRAGHGTNGSGRRVQLWRVCE